MISKEDILSNPELLDEYLKEKIENAVWRTALTADDILKIFEVYKPIMITPFFIDDQARKNFFKILNDNGYMGIDPDNHEEKFRIITVLDGLFATEKKEVIEP